MMVGQKQLHLGQRWKTHAIVALCLPWVLLEGGHLGEGEDEKARRQFGLPAYPARGVTPKRSNS